MIKREFWEHRNSFVLLPAALAILLSLLMLVGILFIDSFDFQINSSQINSSQTTGNNSIAQRNFTIRFDEGDATVISGTKGVLKPQFENNRKTINAGLYGINALFAMVAWGVVIFYFIGSLHIDRRDRSILFWKSMPVSETQTVASKLLVGLVAVPLIMTAVSWLVQLIYVVAALLFAASIGQDPWQAIWPYLNVFQAFANQLGLFVIIALWILPLCAWLMLASAFAKRSPVLVATLPLVAIVAIEAFFFDSQYLANFVANHFPMSERYRDVVLANNQLLELVNVSSMLAGTIIAALLLAGAVWLRNNRFEM
jgi:ABC-2 type transport system permease protein